MPTLSRQLSTITRYLYIADARVLFFMYPVLRIRRTVSMYMIDYRRNFFVTNNAFQIVIFYLG